MDDRTNPVDSSSLTWDDPKVLVAIIVAAVALYVALFSALCFGRRLNKLEEERRIREKALEKMTREHEDSLDPINQQQQQQQQQVDALQGTKRQHEVHDREDSAQREAGPHCTGLLKAAKGFQTRLKKLLDGIQEQQVVERSIEFDMETLYQVCRLVYWMHVVKNDKESTKELRLRANRISAEFESNNEKEPFYISELGQETIADIMKAGSGSDCISWPRFYAHDDEDHDVSDNKLSNFERWINFKLAFGLEELKKMRDVPVRLVHLHNELVDLISFLDPSHHDLYHQYYPDEEKTKIGIQGSNRDKDWENDTRNESNSFMGTESIASKSYPLILTSTTSTDSVEVWE
jgi:hypothetical protein